MLNRRNWLRHSILTTAGAALLAPTDLSALSFRQTNLLEQLSDPGTDEGYWEMVKSQFTFAAGLTILTTDHLVLARITL